VPSRLDLFSFSRNHLPPSPSQTVFVKLRSPHVQIIPSSFSYLAFVTRKSPPMLLLHLSPPRIRHSWSPLLKPFFFFHAKDDSVPPSCLDGGCAQKNTPRPCSTIPASFLSPPAASASVVFWKGSDQWSSPPCAQPIPMRSSNPRLLPLSRSTTVAYRRPPPLRIAIFRRRDRSIASASLSPVARSSLRSLPLLPRGILFFL